MTDSDIEHKEGLWLVRICLILSAMVWAGFVVAFTLAFNGCVARSEVVDQLSKSHAETAAKAANNAEALANTAEILANNTALIAKANETIANLAKVQAQIATEIGSPLAPVAAKIDTIADMQSEIIKVHEARANANAGKAQSLANDAGQHAANALDLSDVPSGVSVDLKDAANKALTGDWVGLGGLIVSTLLGGYAYQQKRKVSQVNKLAEEVRDLEPEKAREVWKQRKPT